MGSYTRLRARERNSQPTFETGVTDTVAKAGISNVPKHPNIPEDPFSLLFPLCSPTTKSTPALSRKPISSTEVNLIITQPNLFFHVKNLSQVQFHKFTKIIPNCLFHLVIIFFISFCSGQLFIWNWEKAASKQDNWGRWGRKLTWGHKGGGKIVREEGWSVSPWHSWEQEVHQPQVPVSFCTPVALRGGPWPAESEEHCGRETGRHWQKHHAKVTTRSQPAAWALVWIARVLQGQLWVNRDPNVCFHHWERLQCWSERGRWNALGFHFSWKMIQYNHRRADVSVETNMAKMMPMYRWLLLTWSQAVGKSDYGWAADCLVLLPLQHSFLCGTPGSLMVGARAGTQQEKQHILYIPTFLLEFLYVGTDALRSMHPNSLNPHTKLPRWVQILSPFTHEEIKAEELDEVACLRSHSWKGAEPGFRPRRHTPKAEGPNHQLFCLWGRCNKSVCWTNKLLSSQPCRGKHLLVPLVPSKNKHTNFFSCNSSS